MNKFYFTLFSCFSSFLASETYSQNIAINTSGSPADAQAILDVSGTAGGILIPRMTRAQRVAISPTASGDYGLLVYQTDAFSTAEPIGFWYWDGTIWRYLMSNAGANSGWTILGNAGTVDGTNFLGTTDDIPFNFRVNNQKAGRIDNPGSATYNTFLGYQAGNATTTGPHNTFMGYMAGAANTTADSNTFIGAYAGRKNTTGEWNTAVGAGALNNNQTSSNNTAIGQLTLFYHTSGDYNVAIGPYSLYSDGTSEKNTAVGMSALYSNTASYNTALGSAALFRNQTGVGNTGLGEAALYNNRGTASRNTATGQAALYENVSGEDLTAIGHVALYANFTSSNNTAIGSAAMRYSDGPNNTAVGMRVLFNSGTGSNNTAVGYQAGYGVFGNAHSNNSLFGYKSGFAITTGSNNILIGHQAGDAITTGANNIVIGYDIDAPSATGSNQMSIGNLIFATGIDGTGTTVSSGNVGVGTASPGEKLEIFSADPTIRVRNQNDQGGGFIGNTWLALQLGMYNPGGSAWGAMAAGEKRSFFGFDYTGMVGSLTNSWWAPVFRNVLDNGSGYAGIGTSSPQGLLDVNGGNTGLDALFVKTDGGAVPWQGGIVHHQGSTYAFKETVQNTSSATLATLQFDYVSRTSPTTVTTSNILVLQSNGSVGIGNNVPPANTRLSLKDGHLQVSQTTAPTVAAGAGLAGGAVSLSNSTDIAGRVNFTPTAATATSGAMVTVTFNKTFVTAPMVIITPYNSVAGTAVRGHDVYVTSTTSAFTIFYNIDPDTAPAVSGVSNQFIYHVIETQ